MLRKLFGEEKKYDSVPSTKPEVPEVDKQKCFDEARNQQFKNILKLIEEKKISPNVTDRSNQTFLHFAARSNAPDVIMELIKLGALVNSYDSDCQTPLHIAAVSRNVTSVKVLLDNGAGVNITDRYGQTALHLALSYSPAHINLQIVRLLIEAKIDLSKVNYNGKTALEVMLYNAQTFADSKDSRLFHLNSIVTITRILLEAGANSECIKDPKSIMACLIKNEIEKLELKELVETLAKEVRDLQREKALAVSPSNPKFKLTTF